MLKLRIKGTGLRTCWVSAPPWAESNQDLLPQQRAWTASIIRDRRHPAMDEQCKIRGSDLNSFTKKKETSSQLSPYAHFLYMLRASSHRAPLTRKTSWLDSKCIQLVYYSWLGNWICYGRCRYWSSSSSSSLPLSAAYFVFLNFSFPVVR